MVAAGRFEAEEGEVRPKTTKMVRTYAGTNLRRRIREGISESVRSDCIRNRLAIRDEVTNFKETLRRVEHCKLLWLWAGLTQGKRKSHGNIPKTHTRKRGRRRIEATRKRERGHCSGWKENRRIHRNIYRYKEIYMHIHRYIDRYITYAEKVRR